MAASSEKGVIRAQALAKHYDAKVAVQDVSLSLQGGEIVGLLGPNGAGKTTTFYMVVGLIPSTHGRVFLDGQNITAEPMWRRARAGAWSHRAPSHILQTTATITLYSTFTVLQTALSVL